MTYETQYRRLSFSCTPATSETFIDKGQCLKPHDKQWIAFIVWDDLMDDLQVYQNDDGLCFLT
jgi:hypothetical protein